VPWLPRLNLVDQLPDLDVLAGGYDGEPSRAEQLILISPLGSSTGAQLGGHAHAMGPRGYAAWAFLQSQTFSILAVLLSTATCSVARVHEVWLCENAHAAWPCNNPNSFT